MWNCTCVHTRHTCPGLQELTKLNSLRRALGPTPAGASCPRGVVTQPRERRAGQSLVVGAHSLQCSCRAGGALGGEGGQAQRTDRNVWRQGAGCGRQELSPAVSSRRRSFSQDALGDYRILYTSPRSHPGPCAGSRCPPGRPPHPSTPQPRSVGTQCPLPSSL